MIQRVQSLYLLIVVALLAVMFLVPMCSIEVISGESTETLKMLPFGVKSVIGGASSYVALTAHMGILLTLCLAVTFFCIFLYRKRWIQIRICFALMVMLAGLQLFVGYFLYIANDFISASNPTADEHVLPISYSVVDVFPIISIIFIYLAFRGIIRDEMLIKSLNRIR